MPDLKLDVVEYESFNNISFYLSDEVRFKYCKFTNCRFTYNAAHGHFAKYFVEKCFIESSEIIEIHIKDS